MSSDSSAPSDPALRPCIFCGRAVETEFSKGWGVCRACKRRSKDRGAARATDGGADCGADCGTVSAGPDLRDWFLFGASIGGFMGVVAAVALGLPAVVALFNLSIGAIALGTNILRTLRRRRE